MYIPSSNHEEILTEINRLSVGKGDVVAIFIGEKDRPDIDQLIADLNAADIEFFGGIFPGVIHGDDKYESGTVITVLPVMHKPVVIHGLETSKICVPSFDEVIQKRTGGKPTAMVLVDGLTSNIARFLQEMFDQMGYSVNYLGGGAGSLSLKQEPCLFTCDGLVQDAAIVTLLDLESQLGVGHGWERLMGPLVVTKAEKNVISELNWQNAFEVYREVVQKDSGTLLTRENFFDVAKGYPFGILKEGLEDVVRDPIAVDDQGQLICVGEVPENTTLSILKGKDELLIKAAGDAASACSSVEDRKVRQSFIVDCISRVIFLEDRFPEELRAVNGKLHSIDEHGIPIGILTLGEISSYGDGFLEFFNKTTVVSVLYEAAA